MKKVVKRRLKLFTYPIVSALSFTFALLMVDYVFVYLLFGMIGFYFLIEGIDYGTDKS